MADRYRVRMATPDDAAVIAHHRRAMFEDMSMSENAEQVEQSFREWVAPQLESGHYIGWLMIDETGQVVAGAGVRLFEWGAMPAVPYVHTRPYLLNVYVEPQHRRQGLARMLIETIIEWARANGYPVLTLHASEFGRPLYEQLGFTPTNEYRLYVTRT